ncbi:MAG: hypothetical protein HYT87_12345 [Nitrospirae bacterium]|nr:hypothetical protein [Nitrospirota bacterium]
MYLRRGSIERALAVFTAWAVAGCDAFRTPAPVGPILLSRSEPASLDLLLADSTLPVQVDATHLSPGDYFGSITITEPSSDSNPVSVRLHARVRSPSAEEPPNMDTATGTDSVSSDSVRKDGSGKTEEPSWVVPPPTEVEPGVEYAVEYTRPRSAEGDLLYSSFRVSSDPDGSGYVSHSSDTSIDPADQTKAKATITFTSCSSGPVYVFFEWFEGGTWRLSQTSITINLLRPTAPTPALDFDSSNLFRTTPTVSRQRIGQLYVSSICGLPMAWRASSSERWLEIAPSAGNIREGDSGRNRMELWTTKLLMPGSYASTVTVTADESGRHDSQSEYLVVAPVRLEWLDAAPASVQSGEEILLRLRPLSGYAPQSIWIEPINLGGPRWSTDPGTIPALPLPDGTFVAPLRLVACSESRYRISAWGGYSQYSTSADQDGASPPVEIQVTPLGRTVLIVKPTVLIVEVAAGMKSRSQEIRLDFPCQNSGERLKISPSHSWILLAPPE